MRTSMPCRYSPSERTERYIVHEYAQWLTPGRRRRPARACSRAATEATQLGLHAEAEKIPAGVVAAALGPAVEYKEEREEQPSGLVRQREHVGSLQGVGREFEMLGGGR